MSVIASGNSTVFRMFQRYQHPKVGRYPPDQHAKTTPPPLTKYLVAGLSPPPDTLTRALRFIVVASLVMGAVVWGCAVWLQDWFVAPSFLVRAGALAILVGAGLAVYGIVILLTGAMQMRQLRTLLRRRGPAE